MRNFRRIGVLTSGGDAPGMNAAVRAVTRYALAGGVEVFGVYEGYKGLMEGNMRLFNERDVSNIISRGGTVLYSARSDEFRTEEGLQKAIKTCRDNNIDGIVAIGGDGTFRGATDLTRHGVPCIGIPGTIDNDITSTDYTLGFDTAMNTVMNMADNLKDTHESHARCAVIEVMGRDAGYIALEAGIAVGAVAIAIPELPFDADAAIERIRAKRAAGARGFIVLVSEGLGGEFGEALTKRIEAETGVESRFARLAHIVRGGKPTLRDRFTAARMGDAAVDALLDGKSNLVICEKDGKIVSRDIEYALVLDRMYKNKLKDGYLDKFSPEDIEKMKAECAKTLDVIKDLYAIANELA